MDSLCLCYQSFLISFHQDWGEDQPNATKSWEMEQFVKMMMHWKMKEMMGKGGHHGHHGMMSKHGKGGHGMFSKLRHHMKGKKCNLALAVSPP